MTSTRIVWNLRFLLLLAGIILLAEGCARPNLTPHRAAVESSYADAIHAMKDNRFHDAMPYLDRVVSNAAVSPDMLADALIRRAVCRADAGDTAAALRDLEQAAPEAPPDVLWIARSFVLDKAGRTAESSAALQMAKGINPQICPW